MFFIASFTILPQNIIPDLSAYPRHRICKSKHLSVFLFASLSHQAGIHFGPVVAQNLKLFRSPLHFAYHLTLHRNYVVVGSSEHLQFVLVHSLFQEKMLQNFENTNAFDL